MNMRLTATALCLAVLLQLPWSTANAATPATSAPEEDSAGNCQQLIDKAGVLIGRLSAGVEKAAAQRELESAKSDLARGDGTKCQEHAHNALLAVKAKSSN